MNDQLIKQLRRDEGVKNVMYKDSLGLWTIGVGHLLDPSRGGHINDATVDFILNEDIVEKQTELFAKAPWIQKLDPVRQGALLNMAFNLGVSGLLGFKNTMALLQAGNYQAASKEMLNGAWAGQVGPRATRLSQQIATGQWV